MPPWAKDAAKAKWQPYMKDVWVTKGELKCGDNSGKAGTASKVTYKDRAGNEYTIECVKAGTIYQLEGYITASGSKKAVVRKGEDVIKGTAFGECKYSGAVNQLVFTTNDKGEFTRILWVNLGVVLQNPKAAFNDPKARAEQEKAQATLQGQLKTAFAAHRDDPAEAEKKLRDIAKTSKLVDQASINIQAYSISIEDIKKP